MRFLSRELFVYSFEPFQLHTASCILIITEKSSINVLQAKI